MDKLTLTELINKTIANSYLVENVDEEYQSTFASEGERKVNYIIDDLKYKESRSDLKLGSLCYLSIGGADGSEVEKVLIETEIKTGIIIEISDTAIQIAKVKAKSLLDTYGKELKVIQGDAFERLDDCLRTIKHYLLINRIDGLVVSAQAVLHELPRRSRNYDNAIFLGKLYSDPMLKHCLFYSREPCSPKEWTDRVRIRIEGVSNSDLYRMACYVRDRLHIKGSPQTLSSNWLDLESVLAIETLHKILRNDTVRRIEYELGEQLTEFDPIAIKRNLESCVEGMKVSVEYITTAGFKRALSENNVEFIGHNSEPLPVPKTHVEIIGFKTTKQGRVEHFYGNSVFITHSEDIVIDSSKAINEKKRISLVNFTNPFDGDISNEKIIDFLVQFDIDEIPIVSKLIDNFKYVSSKKLEVYCKLLYQEIASNYKDQMENIVFIPFGRASKSSGLISYFFRTINSISEHKFLSVDSLKESKLKGKILVFIDDLLASGHQALNELSRFQNNEENDTCLAVLVSCEQGVELIQEKSNINVLSALKIKRIDNPLHFENHQFDASEKEALNKMVTSPHYRPGNFNPFGYAGLSLLLGFYYQTPDNTFPIFWSPKCLPIPLLKRDNLGRSDTRET